MSSCRQSYDIWYYLFSFYGGGKWMGWALFTWRFWKWGYKDLWQDSFGKYWYRWVRCKFFLHPVGSVKQTDVDELWCFACQREVK